MLDSAAVSSLKEMFQSVNAKAVLTTASQITRDHWLNPMLGIVSPTDRLVRESSADPTIMLKHVITTAGIFFALFTLRPKRLETALKNTPIKAMARPNILKVKLPFGMKNIMIPVTFIAIPIHFFIDNFSDKKVQLIRATSTVVKFSKRVTIEAGR